MMLDVAEICQVEIRYRLFMIVKVISKIVVSRLDISHFH